MTLITFAQVFVVCLLGAMSPGPSMAVVINNAIFKGRYSGILTAIGHGIGIAVYATFAILGLGLLIQTNILIFNGLKILSVIFLIFLGLKNELFFNIYLIAIAGAVDTFWYLILTLAITTSSMFIFFKTKISLIRKIQGFFFISIGTILFLEILFKY